MTDNYRVISRSVTACEPTDEGFIAINVKENRLPLDENGNPCGSVTPHRTVLWPDHDATNDHPTVKAICESIHDAEWKGKYQAKLDAEAAKAEAERLEQERLAAEAEAEAQAAAEQAAAEEQARIDAAVAAALAAQSE
jgi:hypothetical protein